MRQYLRNRRIRQALRDQMERFSNSDPNYWEAYDALEQFESDQLLNQAIRLGIIIDFQAVVENGWYDLSGPPLPEGHGKLVKLSFKGRAELSKLVREERFRRAEQWTKLASPFIVALTGLLALILSLVTFFLR